MKKAPPFYSSYSYIVPGPITVYRQDLEAIDAIFAEAYPAHSVCVNQYSLDEIGELEALASKFETARSVHFNGPESNASTLEQAQEEDRIRAVVSLEDHVHLYALYGNSPTPRGVLAQVEAILERCRPRVGSIRAHVFPVSTRCRIFLKYRQDQPSFWRRNKDRIAVAVIAAMTGGILGATTTWLIGK